MAAWDLLKNEKETGSLDLAVVNPSLVIGPSLSSNVGTSLDIAKQILTRKMKATPHVCMNVVDVRDVAEGIVRAMVSDKQQRVCVFSRYSAMPQTPPAVIERTVAAYMGIF